ncbi:MAG: hypothetical protein E4H18_03875, partial [Hyphomicrobiales bacterium]
YPEGWIHVRPSNTEAILRLIGEAAAADWLAARLDAAATYYRTALA